MTIIITWSRQTQTLPSKQHLSPSCRGWAEAYSCGRLRTRDRPRMQPLEQLEERLLSSVARRVERL